ncbi:lipid-binding SYLF domain-containing protein [Aspergillus undulatus]|uniref:lipid-binding SYLF domain-containing protein n=1 Tax=Aspergillus undulatus TaxID=1810928 RepID=UPI003CCDA315
MAPTFWERTKGTSKKGFDKAWHALDKLGDPVNRLSNRVGAEAFWPMTIDEESDKAARILRSFCKDGFYAEEESDAQSAESVYNKETGKIEKPKGKQRVIKKIPTKVIQEAKGIAIFTTMRTGLWLSGSGGSGVLLARIPETGEWSPPSGIMLHTAGIGFLAGIDIYDCVVVINTFEALEAFKKVRCTLGGEVSASAGPVGMGGVLESEVHKRQAPIWTYMKSRGLYAGVQVDGTIIIERTDENERFYGERISVTDILAGKVKHPPASIQPLLQTIKAAQGDMDVNEALLPSGETPGDVDLQQPAMFGVPDPEDDDPFGVKALEAEGLFIREAGSKTRPSQDAFEFKPNPSSPVYASFRRSVESSRRNSWRTSVQSYVSQDRGTQTFDEPLTAPTSISRASSPSNRDFSEPRSNHSDNEDRWDTVIPEHRETSFRSPVQDQGVQDKFINDEKLEVHEVSSAKISRRDSITNSSPVEVSVAPIEMKRASPTFTRARLVTIPKRQPPSLPPRNPHRTSTTTSTPTSPAHYVSSDDNRSVASVSTRASTGEPAPSASIAKKNFSAGESSIDEKSGSKKSSFGKDDDFHSDIGIQDETARSRSRTPDADGNHFVDKSTESEPLKPLPGAFSSPTTEAQTLDLPAVGEKTH